VTLGPIVAARAFIHVFFGVIGAHLYRRGLKFWQVLLLVLPIHALGEALITMPFGFDFYQALVVVRYRYRTAPHSGQRNDFSAIPQPSKGRRAPPENRLKQKALWARSSVSIMFNCWGQTSSHCAAGDAASSVPHLFDHVFHTASAWNQRRYKHWHR